VNRLGGITIRFSALAFIGLVLAAIALLIAGYGPAVGLGAFVGFVLGTLAGLVGLMWLGRGSGRTFGVGGMHWLSADQSRGPDPDQMAEMHAMFEIFGVDLGEVRRVIPVLATTAAAGLAVELVAVEVREAGLGMTFDVAIGLGTPQPPGMARLSIRDATGTAYRGSVQGGGSALSRTRFTAVAIPAPPPGADALTVSLDELLDPFPGPGRRVVGPWVFRVSLA
jgi:hypothetical protein